MNFSNDKHLVVLPRVFQTDTGEVDLELLKNIFAGIPSPSGKIRDLLRQISGIKLSHKDDPFLRLSIELPEINFREQWYQATVTKKGKTLMPLYGIVDTFVNQIHQNLGIKSPELKQFFEARQNKTFPRLELIEKLSEQLILTATHSLTDSALFAWSLLESTQFGSISLPNEKSLTNFRDVLLCDLEKRGASDLLAQLEDGVFLKDDAKSSADEPEHKTHNQKILKPSDLGIEKTNGNNHEPDSVKELDELHISKILELDELIEQINAEHRRTIAIVKRILSSQDAAKEVNDLIESQEKMRNFVCSMDGCSTDIENGIADILTEATQRLSIALVTVKLPKFSIATYAKWKLEMDVHLEVAREVLRRANDLTKFEDELIRTIICSHPEKSITLENAAQYLTIIENESKVLSSGLTAWQDFRSLVESKQEDFTWNPIFDTSIPSNCWIDVGKYLAAQGSMPRVLGICARKHYEQLHTRVAGLIDKLSTRDDMPMEDAFDVLTSMTLGQIERLKCNTEEGNTLLATVELESFLHIADSSPTEAYAFWSAKPLNKYVNEHGSTATEHFFRAAFKVSSLEGGKNLTIIKLRHLIGLANAASLSNPEQLKESLREDLLAILKFHPGGGQTYSQLWSLAYEVICIPLKEKADQSKLDDVAELYRIFRSEFDIEDHLRIWKSTLPERIRKRSEYEKKLRLVVQGKLDELDEWLNSFKSTKQLAASTAENEQVVMLKEAISEILSARDGGSKVLKRWFQTISKASNRRQPNMISLTRTIEPNFTVRLHQGNNDAFHPRTFLAETSEKFATVADFLADEIFLGLGLFKAEGLARVYADQHCYEAFSALSVAAPEELSVDLERSVEAAIDELETQYLTRIEAIEAKTTTLDPQYSELIVTTVVDVRRWLSNQQWMKVDLELSDVEKSLNGFLKDGENNRFDQERRAEIVALGGNVPIGANLIIVKEIHEQLIAQSKPRRQHLVCLTKLVAIEGLSTAVKDEFSTTVSLLERPEKLPSEIQSSEVAYIFSVTVEILEDQIRRSKSFLPAYTKKLNILALTVAKCLSLYGVNEDSRIISFLVETEADWQSIPEGGVALIELLLSKFAATEFAAVLASEPDIQPDIAIDQTIQARVDRPSNEQPLDTHDIFAAYIDRLFVAILRVGAGTERKILEQLTTSNIGKFDIKISDEAKKASSLIDKCVDSRSALAMGHLTDWAVSMLREHEEMLSVEEHAAAFHMINRFQGTASVRALLPSKNTKGRLGELATRFLARVARDCGLAALSNPIEQIQNLSDNIGLLKTRRSLFVISFTPVGSNDSLMTKYLWESYSGDTRQAEARAALMNILWQTSAPLALACCMKYSPIEIDGRTADALANIADQALSKGRVDLLQSYVDLRRTVSAKPFQLFVEQLQSKMPTKADPPAQISLVGPLERDKEPNKLNGILSIKPRRSDSPNLIVLKLPQSAPVSFDFGAFKKELKGPFIEEETLLSIHFRLCDQNAHDFTVPIECEAISITGVASSFSIRLNIEILGAGYFARIPAEEIEEAFHQFPHGQMRGDDYIHRPDDERRIENDLFKSKTIRSLWISSPRRSGKTTMLYRILDAYSHKVGRDNLIAYFSLSKSFDSTTSFNDWLWKTLKNSTDNSELRGLYDDFSDLGRDLPHEADVGTFIEVIAERLVTTATGRAARTIFLFDEIDKLATMFFEGGKRKDTAIDIAWQLRELIGRRRDIGFVFAGSSAAKKIFLTNQDAPFFNAGILFELSPFSCSTQVKENYAREIVEPPRIRGRLTIPRTSLERMLWVCSGIPYYMKLLAGATYAVAKQSHVLMSDVNEGLHALLEKRTGISLLDEVEGDPGSDELRTIALEKGADRLLTQGVLYAVAELESPLSGHPIHRASLYSESSPLIARYQLSRQGIERGLDRAIELGLLKLSGDSRPQISYAIPILGESIRHACGSYWAEIDHQLEQLGVELREGLT